MTSPVDSGQLSVDVVADLTGFAQKLAAEVDKAARGATADIGVRLARGAVGELRASLSDAAGRASRDVVGEVGVRLVRNAVGQLRTALKEAADRASSGTDASVGVKLDTRRLRSSLQAAVKEASAGIEIIVPVRADARHLRADVDAAVARARAGQSIEVPVRSGGGDRGGDSAGSGIGAGVGGALSGAMSAVQAGAIGLAVSLAPGLAVAATELAAALGGPLLGAMGALPAAFSALGQGAGVLLTAFHGIGAALKALDAQQQESSQNATQLAQQERAQARQREQAAQAVGNAQTALAGAYASAADRTVAANESVQRARLGLTEAYEEAGRRTAAADLAVQQAERGVATAQREVLQAQQDLTNARRDATRQLQDMNLQLQQGQVDEQQAVMRVQDAETQLQQVRANNASPHDVQQYTLALEDAQLALQRIRIENQRNQQDTAVANQKGVEGSDLVKNAQVRLSTAQQAQVDAVRQLQAARNDVARTEVENQRSIAAAQLAVTDALRQQETTARENARSIAGAQQALANAQQSLADALAQTNTAGAAAAAKVKSALDALSPSAQAFVYQLRALKPLWDQFRNSVQQAIFPLLSGALARVTNPQTGLFATLQRGAVGTARVFGQLAQQGAALVTSPAFRADIGNAMAFNNRMLLQVGQSALRFMDVLRNLTIAAQPFIRVVNDLITQFSTWAQQTVQAKRDSGALADTFRRWGQDLRVIVDIVKNVGVILAGVFRAAAPEGRSLLQVFDRLVQRGADWVRSIQGSQRLRQIFAEARPVVQEIFRLIGALAAAIGRLGEHALGGGFAGIISQLRTQLLPALEATIGQLGKAGGQLLPSIVTALSSVVRLVGDLAKSGGGGLVVLVQSLGDLARALDWAVRNVPGVNLLVDAIVALVIAGRVKSQLTGAIDAIKDVGGAAKSASQFVLGLSGNAAAFGTKAGTWGLAIRDMASSLGSMAVNAGRAVAAMAASAWASFTGVLARVGQAALVASRQMLAFTASLLTNPIFLIIAALVLLGVGIYELYKHWDTVWGWIKGVVGAAWNFIKQHWELILGLFFPMVLALVELYKHWDQVWGWIKDAVRAAFHFISGLVTDTFEWLKARFKDVGDGIVWLWDHSFGVLWSTTKDVMGWIHDRIFDILGSVRTAFDDAVKFIGQVWDGLKEAARKPVAFVVNTVYNDGIRAIVNKVSGWLGMGDALPRVEGFATGGGYQGVTGRYTTKSDDRVIAVRGGEHVWTPEEVRGAGGHERVAAMRSAALGGKPVRLAPGGGSRSFDSGGGFSIAGWHVPGSGLVTSAVDTVEGWASGLVGLLRRGAADAVDGLLSPIRALADHAIPGGGWGDDLKQTVHHLSDAVVGFVRGKEEPDAPTGSGGYHTILEWLAAHGVPFNQPTLGQTTGGQHAKGSYHYQGLAVDLSGTPAMMRNIFDRLAGGIGPYLAELFYDPVGWYIKNGQRVAGAIGGHIDHVHAAIMAQFAGNDVGPGALASGSTGGVEQWRGTVLQALQMLGQPASWADVVLRRLNQESSGNTTAVNRTDINWQHGTPSVGLMQVIGPTFARFAGAFRNVGPFLYGVSINPLANIFAGLNYDLNTYGSLASLTRPGGYALGGTVLPRRGGTLARVAEAGKAETIVDTNDLNQGFGRLEALLARGTAPINVYPSPGMDEVELALKVERELSWATR